MRQKTSKNETNRKAQFKTVIALNYNNQTFTFEGVCKGKITRHKIGSGGFGYDPIFIPKGRQKTFAELSLEEKNTIGHRGLAIAKLISFLKMNHN